MRTLSWEAGRPQPAALKSSSNISELHGPLSAIQFTLQIVKSEARDMGSLCHLLSQMAPQPPF